MRRDILSSVAALAAVSMDSTCGFVSTRRSALPLSTSSQHFIPSDDAPSQQQQQQQLLGALANGRSSAASTRVEASTTANTEEATAVKSSQQSSSPPPDDWQTQVLSGLSTINDPDLNSDIVSLGFVQNLNIDDSSIVSLDLELTTPACPVKDQFVQQCQDVINAFDWTRGADVTLTAQPTTNANSVSAEGGTAVPVGMSQIGAIIAVSSCKGGVGKSTTAVNLAYALQSLGARVGIFDADIYGPSLPTMITPEDDNVRFIGRQIAPLQREGISLMSFGYVNEGSAVMRGPMVTQLLDQFLSLTNWGALDYLILDMPPGTGDIQLTLSQKLDITAAVIVTTPTELSFVDVERGVEMFDTVEVPCVAVVENMAYIEKDGGGGVSGENGKTIDEGALKEKFAEVLALEQQKVDGIVVKDGSTGSTQAIDTVVNGLVKIVQESIQPANEGEESDQIRIFGPGHKHRLSEQYGIEHTYSVPLLSQIASDGDSGTPYILQHPNTSQAKIYTDLAKSVVGEVAKIKFGRGGKGSGMGRPSVRYNSDLHLIELVEASGRSGDNVGGDDDEQKDEVSTTMSTISPAELRRECRCAACVEELTGKQILNPESVSESVKPLAMSPTGNYALSVDWSDGHRSLYPYRQLRSLIVAGGSTSRRED